MMGVGVVSSILLGVLLDFCFGDPYWLPHPVVWIGKGISAEDRKWRETVGRMNTQLAAQAETVERIFCGLSMQLRTGVQS